MHDQLHSLAILNVHAQIPPTLEHFLVFNPSPYLASNLSVISICGAEVK
ncbi:unnamed protein product [Rhodiola kirilowii]